MRYREIAEDVFHGSPYKFKKFSLDKVDTGEGNQTFGWGLYFTDTKEVAEYYRNRLSHYTYNGRSVPRESNLDSAIRWFLDNDRDKKAAMAQWKPTSKVYQMIADLDPSKIGFKGRLYNVSIPDDHYLLWDARFNDQPENVQAALMKLLADDNQIYYQMPSGGPLDPIEPDEIEMHKRLLPKIGGKMGTKADFLRMSNATGEVCYENLAQILGSPENASKTLQRHGVPGLKYLDQQSRDGGKGTFNYVIFDDSLVKINNVE